MILLEATRLNPDRFGYTVQVAGREPFQTSDPDRASRALARLGVANPQHLIDHVRQWGMVEIHEHTEPDKQD